MSWQWNYGCMFPGSPAAPGQRQIETSSWVDPDGLFGAPYNIVEDNNNNNNNNNNVCWQQKGIKIRFRSQNYMGASFWAPHAAPRQRQMETHHDSLIVVLYFSMSL